MLYDRFRDESAFSTQFVLPLLNRLGFREVTLTHGQREFGKDFVFAETTRFGFSKYNAAQVKHSENITQIQHAVLNDILRQIREALTVPASLANPTRDQYMSSVYIFNSGGITEGAKTYLLESLKRGTVGDNVHIFDGASLESANQFAAYAAERDFRPRLLGLRNQLVVNHSVIWPTLLKDLPAFKGASGSLISAIEGFLAAPIAVDFIHYGEMIALWDYTRTVDTIFQRYIVGSGGGTIMQEDIATTRTLLTDLIAKATKVQKDVDRALETLKPLPF